jgi:hypothetical protein
MFLKPILVPIATWLDDKLMNGKRNLAKKWWFDHEIVGGVTIAAKATNERDIDPTRKLDPAKQKIAYYHANMMPPPDAPGPAPVNRKAALEAKDVLETPEEARRRKASGGATPAHYLPAPALSERGEIEKRTASPYAAE